MKQTIRFTGLNLALDEQAAQNGALAVCEGMELHGGALRPCVIEGEAVQNEHEILGEILYIHELTNGKKNAIYVDDTLHTLYYIDITGTEVAVALDSGQTVISRDMINAVTSNGNTLVLLTTMGMRYFRWKDNSYKYLGKMPELEMEFSLKKGEHMVKDFRSSDSVLWDSKPYLYQVSGIMTDNYYEVDGSVDYKKSENLLAREEAMEAALGKGKQECYKAKYFALPFYVRYCYRLWDGRKVMHSAPVLLYTDITYPEAVWVGYEFYALGDPHVHIPFLLPQQLNVDVKNASVINTLKTDWEDIINSIDVYITPGISRRDETVSVDIPEGGDYPWEGKWKHIYYNQNDDEHRPSSMTAINLVLEKNEFTSKYRYILALDDNRDIWTMGVPYINCKRDGNDYKNCYGLFIPQQIGDEQWKERLINQNAYYLLRRFKLKDGEKPESGVFPIEDGILENIEAQEQMITSTAPDDYRTHHEVIAATSYVYNNRINLTGIQEIPFNGFPMYCMSPNVSGGGNILKTIIVRLDDNGESVYVKTDYDVSLNYYIHNWYIRNTFLFYPDSRAREMWIYSHTEDGRLEAHFILEEHPLLNGAYHIGDLSSGNNYPDSTPATSDTDPRSKFTENYTPRLLSPNYIFTSASGNPFVFPAAHRYAVGLGEVKAIASTTRALSQGQFGQYPMIAFASDGIYALDVSPTGSYSGIQPISREVITNPKALLQLDQSIAFITRRAINQLISSDVNELSAALSGPLRNLKDMLPDRDGNEIDALSDTRQVPDLIAAVQNADAVYDFVDSRLLYFLKDSNGAYTGDVLAFCTTDTAWVFKFLGEGEIRGVYNSYPYPYIHHKDGTLYCLSAPYDNKEQGNYDGIIITRTIKADGVRSAIREFFQDYDCGAGTRPMLMLWGSDDNRTWHYIGKSNARQMGRLPGRIYRYFRFAVQFSGMKRNDLYHAVQLDIQERFTR